MIPLFEGVEYVHEGLDPALLEVVDRLLMGYELSLLAGSLVAGAWAVLEELVDGPREPEPEPPPGPWTWRDVLFLVLFVPLLVALGWCGLHVSSNAGITLYHGNGPGARGIFTVYPGLAYGPELYRVACRDHPEGHLEPLQRIMATLQANRHRYHRDALGRGFPWCCYAPGEPRHLVPEASSSSRSAAGGAETP